MQPCEMDMNENRRGKQINKTRGSSLREPSSCSNEMTNFPSSIIDKENNMDISSWTHDSNHNRYHIRNSRKRSPTNGVQYTGRLLPDNQNSLKPGCFSLHSFHKTKCKNSDVLHSSLYPKQMERRIDVYQDDQQDEMEHINEKLYHLEKRRHKPTVHSEISITPIKSTKDAAVQELIESLQKLSELRQCPITQNSPNITSGYDPAPPKKHSPLFSP